MWKLLYVVQRGAIAGDLGGEGFARRNVGLVVKREVGKHGIVREDLDHPAAHGRVVALIATAAGKRGQKRRGESRAQHIRERERERDGGVSQECHGLGLTHQSSSCINRTTERERESAR